MLKYVITDIVSTSQPDRVPMVQRFFKTWKWQYGEWDIFLWHSVPDLRIIAKRYYKTLTLNEYEHLLQSPYHENRLVSLMMLVYKMAMKKTPCSVHKPPSSDFVGHFPPCPQDSLQSQGELTHEIFEFYLKNTKFINNRDLVDTSAPWIVGKFLIDQQDRKILYKLAKSKSLREKRISIVSTFWFIRQGQLDDTIAIAKILLWDTHDLIHKAVWRALREVGKKKKTVLVEFLDIHYAQMPRTMLRYAIEKFPEHERKEWLKRK